MARLLKNSSFLKRALLAPQGLRRGGVGTSSHVSNYATKGRRRSKSDSSDSAEDGMSKKELALEQALNQITSQYGKGSIMWFGRSIAPKDVPVVSTGSFALDIALGTGGLPKVC
uniref:RecA family protein n=1 Tax=Rhizophora mucronata TaxID=61149 RepID=A0A2P2JTG7_RHIMU